MPAAVDLTSYISHFMLILLRMSAFFIGSPVLGRNNVPGMTKVAIAFTSSLILFNLFPPQVSAAANTIYGYVIICILEILAGLVIGYINTLFFSVVFTAGQIIDMQVGFSMAQVFDAQTNVQVPIAGSLLNLVLMLSFLLTNGHLDLIRLMFKTFTVMPIGRVAFTPEIGLLMLEMFAQSFVIAIRIAMPVIASGLIAELSLGIIVRTSPQMNVFVVGIPIKIIIGLVILILIIPVFVSLTGPIFDYMFSYIETMFESVVVKT